MAGECKVRQRFIQMILNVFETIITTLVVAYVIVPDVVTMTSSQSSV